MVDPSWLMNILIVYKCGMIGRHILNIYYRNTHHLCFNMIQEGMWMMEVCIRALPEPQDGTDADGPKTIMCDSQIQCM